MNNDIVKRLHGEHYCDQCEDIFLPNDEGSGVLSPGLHSLAALEIERLRAVVTRAKEMLRNWSPEYVAELDAMLGPVPPASAGTSIAESNDRADVLREARHLLAEAMHADLHRETLPDEWHRRYRALSDAVPPGAPAQSSDRADAAPMDEGPWHVLGDKVSGDLIGVSSDDFKRDVLLRVDGDFGCAMEKADYCAWLARTLNLNTGHSHCPHCGQWHRLELGC